MPSQYKTLNTPLIKMLGEFFQKYYVDPIIYNTGYNIVNTLTYALLLISAVFLVHRLLLRMHVRIDRHFFYAVMPFIALGSIMRVYEDTLESLGTAGGPLTIM